MCWLNGDGSLTPRVDVGPDDGLAADRVDELHINVKRNAFLVLNQVGTNVFAGNI